MSWLVWHLYTRRKLRRLSALADRLLARGEDIGWLVEAYDELASTAPPRRTAARTLAPVIALPQKPDAAPTAQETRVAA